MWALMTSVGVGLVITAALSGASGPPPTLADLRQAMRAALVAAQRAPLADGDLRGVDGCYPAEAGRGVEWLCMADLKGRDGQFRLQPLPLTRASGDWQIVRNAMTASPACPTGAEAARLLAPKMGTVQVTSKPDSGLFSDQRGLSRDKPGPLRLMCTWGVRRPGGGEATATGYLRYTNDAYVLEELETMGW